MTVFKKAIAFTDVHFGRGSNSALANQDNLDFIDWAIEQGKTWGAETCILSSLKDEESSFGGIYTLLDIDDEKYVMFENEKDIAFFMLKFG